MVDAGRPPNVWKRWVEMARSVEPQQSARVSVVGWATEF